jgi:hypothetical protein
MKPTFTTSDVLLATALIGVGLAVLVTGFGIPLRSDNLVEPLVGLALWFGGPTIIGAGAGWPFKRPILGAALGFFAMFLFFFLFIFGNC